MIKTIFLTALTVAIAVAGGAASVWMVLDADIAFDTVAVGGWTAHPRRGTADADPYARARFSREADLALGIGEGLVFTASRDAEGEPLSLACTYRLEGEMPAARFWTLHAREPGGAIAARPGARPPALHSYALLREADSSVATTISRHPAPGNWLAVAGDGPLVITLTLYDTAIASSARVADIELPRVTREDCDD